MVLASPKVQKTDIEAAGTNLGRILTAAKKRSRHIRGHKCLAEVLLLGRRGGQRCRVGVGGGGIYKQRNASGM